MLESIAIACFSIINFSFYENFKYIKNIELTLGYSLFINIFPTAMLI